jgi:hypothetical protein
MRLNTLWIVLALEGDSTRTTLAIKFPYFLAQEAGFPKQQQAIIHKRSVKYKKTVARYRIFFHFFLSFRKELEGRKIIS